MERFLIEGGHRIEGSVRPEGNKNAAMPMMCAALLTDQPITLHNVPRIGDVHNLILLLQQLGVECNWFPGNSLRLTAHSLTGPEPDSELFQSLRGSLTLMGPLLGRLGEFRVASAAGGDQIGRRRIDTHLQAFQAMGAVLDMSGDAFSLQIDGTLTGADILLDEASVTATENALLMASCARGVTILHNAACEPHVADLCHLLVAMGTPIAGIGTNRLIIEGQNSLQAAEATISPDFMEIGTYIGLGAITEGVLRIEGVLPTHLRMIEMVFRDRLGVTMEYQAVQPDGTATLVLAADQSLEVRSDYAGDIPRISSAPWPGFPTDLLGIALVTATQARGTVLIHEKMFESRLYFVDKLIGMGAQIVFCDPHRVVVAGPSQLYGQPVSSPDIRAGMALVLAALGAKGTTSLSNVVQIDRGYHNVDQKLARLGAVIERRAE